MPDKYALITYAATRKAERLRVFDDVRIKHPERLRKGTEVALLVAIAKNSHDLLEDYDGREDPPPIAEHVELAFGAAIEQLQALAPKPEPKPEESAEG